MLLSRLIMIQKYRYLCNKVFILQYARCCLHTTIRNNGDQGDDGQGTVKIIEMVVTSLRVDRVLASGLGLSRRKVDNSLLAGHVYLNGVQVAKKSRQVIPEDIIDRISDTQPNKKEVKFGQVKMVEVGKLTKKGNYHITISRQKSVSMPGDEFWNNHE